MNANRREYTNSIDLLIIIVSYNVRDLLRQCLRSLDRARTTSNYHWRVIVVDNASSDESGAVVRAEFPHIDLIQLDRNLGFAGGNNVAMKHLAAPSSDLPFSSSPPPRAVLLLNPDTEIVDDAIDQMLLYLDAHADVAVIGPQLRYGDDTLQSSRRRWPTVATLFWESTLLAQWWPRNPWARRYHLLDRAPDTTQDVDWLVGAALLVRWAAIEKAGRLDDTFFMYSEELEWQQRLARFGRIVYLPAAIIRHYEGKSSEQNLARRHINFNRSKLRYVRMRWGGGVVLALRAFLLITYLIQLLIEAAKWLLGHKRALRRDRIRHYSAVLRSGL